jgi:hypothetical protein
MITTICTANTKEILIAYALHDYDPIESLDAIFEIDTSTILDRPIFSAKLNWFLNDYLTFPNNVIPNYYVSVIVDENYYDICEISATVCHNYVEFPLDLFKYINTSGATRIRFNAPDGGELTQKRFEISSVSLEIVQSSTKMNQVIIF